MELKNIDKEWCLLQNQFDSYEKHSLYIKLVSISMLFVYGLFNINVCLVGPILLVLWLQDAIWKTFQSRIEPRLLEIERMIREKTEGSAFQFNSEYKLTEGGSVQKLGEYAKQALRPTIAFPHAILIVILVGQYLLS